MKQRKSQKKDHPKSNTHPVLSSMCWCVAQVFLSNSEINQWKQHKRKTKQTKLKKKKNAPVKLVICVSYHRMHPRWVFSCSNMEKVQLWGTFISLFFKKFSRTSLCVLFPCELLRIVENQTMRRSERNGDKGGKEIMGVVKGGRRVPKALIV